MYKEVLLIVPKMAAGELNVMEELLGRRFSKIAKRFGKGLVATLTGGGIAGLALGLVDKILNPLKETQEAIDRVLRQGDDLVTNAKQFGTTAGKLARLQALGKSTGLEEGSLFTLLQKFQVSLAEAAADPNKATSVRQFVGSKDIAESFFEFIQSLQKMTKEQKVLVQQEVFGEKQILKMSDFLETEFAWQQLLLGGPDAEKLTPRIESLGKLNDLKDLQHAHLDLENLESKGRLINAKMVKSAYAREKLDLERENRQVKSYEDLAAISLAATEIMNLGKDAILGLTGMIVKVTDISNNIRKLTESRVVKGLLKMTGGGN